MRQSLRQIRQEIVRSRVPYGTVPPLQDVPAMASPSGQLQCPPRMPAMPACAPNDYNFQPMQDVSWLDLAQYMQAANLLIEVPGIPAIGPGVDSPGERVEFRTEPVLVIGMRGCASDFTVGSFASGQLEQSSIAVRLQINSDDNLTTNGQTADFVTFANLFPNSMQFCPLMIQLPATTILHCQFRNQQPVAGGHVLQPRLTFYCRTLSGRG